MVFEPAQKRGEKDKLVITEIPYTMIGANIGKFISDVVELIESKKATDIVDISNESSKEGIRIVLELKKNADVENLKNLLYKKTKLEDTFGVNMLAIVDGRPETLGIKKIIEHHINFQYEIATRKYTTLLNKELANKEIKEGRTSNVILLSEALHEKKMANIADDIAKRKNVKMVLIAGPSSSGKTTFAKRLGVELRLNGLKPVTISVDNYFVERVDNPKDENGDYDFECLEAIDLELFNNHIKTLLDGGTIDVPTFDFKVGTKRYNGEKMHLEDDEILVIEGIHCLNDKLTSSIPMEQKYKIYISDLTVLNIDYCNRISTTDTRLIRRIVRDNNFRGYSALHTLRTWASVNRGENKNIFPYQENCDVMFNSSLIYELSVLKKQALPLLQEITNAEPEYAEAKRLAEFLKYFEEVDEGLIPQNSLLREFVGGSIFGD